MLAIMNVKMNTEMGLVSVTTGGARGDGKEQ